MSPELVAIAALDDDRVIGADGSIPWDLPADTRQYRERVADYPVILGRRTFEAVRDDLPGSVRIVLSRSRSSFDTPNTHHAGDVDTALELADDLDADAVYVLGGGTVYDLFLPHCDRLVLTHVSGEHEGDTRFPDWDRDAWQVVCVERYDRFVVREWEPSG